MRWFVVASQSALLRVSGLVGIAITIMTAACTPPPSAAVGQRPPMVSNLRNSFMSGAVRRGSDLEAVEMSGVRAARADFRGANLKHARLDQAILTGALFDGADLRGADLRGAEVSFASFRGALFDDSTRLPETLSTIQRNELVRAGR